MRQNRWPTETELNNCLAMAADWFKRHRVAEDRAWPVSAGGREPSLWGGTVEAVCAITALRHCGRQIAAILDDVDLRASREWIRSQQHRDGSFESGEFGFAGAEPTAWALIALHEESATASNRQIATGLAYLESCIDERDGSVSSIPGSAELPRTLPSALTLWAFGIWRHRDDLQERIRSYLLRCQDNTSHAWGVNSHARPNAATTAQVVVAFQRAGFPSADYEMAARFLVEQQRNSGRWPNSVDEWHVSNGRSAMPVANKCANSGTAWGLLALAQVEDHRSRAACLRAVQHLIATQTVTGPPEVRGSWTLWEDGAQRHVWLTGQIILAIAAWRASLPPQGIRREGMRVGNAFLRVFDIILNRAPLISTLGVFGAVLAMTADIQTADQLVGDGTTFRQSLLTSGLSAATIGALSWIYRGIRDWRARRRRR